MFILFRGCGYIAINTGHTGTPDSHEISVMVRMLCGAQHPHHHRNFMIDLFLKSPFKGENKEFVEGTHDYGRSGTGSASAAARQMMDAYFGIGITGLSELI
jgi:hypothetical protein